MPNPTDSTQPDNIQRYASHLGLLQETDRYRQCGIVDPGLLDFSSNDYLGLSQHPLLKARAAEAIARDGVGSTGSRLISGSSDAITLLEERVADWKQTEAALVLNSGYQANVSILQAILQPGDWVFCDALNHASLNDGVLLSGARLARYHHRDLQHLAEKLAKAPKDTLKWIVTDSVFSMDGTLADCPALVALADAFGAQILLDEAHASGVYGESRASGLSEAQGMSGKIHLQMGTFSKALGGFGAYLAGSRTMIETVINRGRGFIYSTALPPAVIAAADAAVHVVQTEPEHRKALWQRMEQVHSRLGVLSHPSHIVPLHVGEGSRAMGFNRALKEAGFFLQAIRPPTVPENTARLRLSLSARHTPEQVDALCTAWENLKKDQAI
ncbi:MAG: 8-amino-7-oxononanoate synthase [Cyanobacteria bacterium]|nr:8-amino-7-oxononanoate synthase [Cyanobacteriota bacterium]